MKTIIEFLINHIRLNKRRWQIHRIKRHVLKRISQAQMSFEPFGNMFISEIFPADFLNAIRTHLQECKSSEHVHDRLQDNPEYTNRRYNLLLDQHEVPCILRAVFSDSQVKAALAHKFFLAPKTEFIDQLSIHKEFEYVFTAPGRFQNIHTDIPAKYLSLVFYFPPKEMTEEEELLNATILYDKQLNPAYKARYQLNSVCVFAQHFYSYHGFSTTTERDALVMFYVIQSELDKWRSIAAKEAAPFSEIRDQIEEKLQRFPLIEYGVDSEKLRTEKAACKINAPHGRVLKQ